MADLVTYVESIKKGNEQWYKLGRGGIWTVREWWQHLARLPLVVLDDVGLREINNDLQLETLFLALQSREDQPLICTSNRSPNNLEEKYDSRIRSRACCGTVKDLGAGDRRFGEPTEF